VPLQIGVLEFPIPSARRCYRLGQSLRKAIESYPEDLKVVLVATGGLSHQVHGERCGFNNTEWDLKFLDLIEHDPLAGIEKLSGTYPFTLARSVKGYRLNTFLHNAIDPAWRDTFRADQESLFETAGLSAEERQLVRTRDWRGMIHYGVSVFVLEKLGAVVGASNLHIYAAMRGETFEQFQKTRNAPGALYSVAGADAKREKLSWDTADSTA
jgi:protocatechuate 4,5-dioxygenase alpha subunit